MGELWRRIREWIAGAIYPEGAEEDREKTRTIVELSNRLKSTHARMQEMYWDEQSKKASLGMIELLQEEIARLDPENELLKKIRAAAGGAI